MKRWIHAKSDNVMAGVGSGRRERYVLIDYPDREPIRNIDTGSNYSFPDEESALKFIDDNPYFVDKYPGIQPERRIEYNVWHA